jgi:hypothetical protein
MPQKCLKLMHSIVKGGFECLNFRGKDYIFAALLELLMPQACWGI